MDVAPDSPFEPGSTPYGPPAGAIPLPAPVAAPVPPPAAAPAPADYPPPLVHDKINPHKNGFGVTSVWIGVLAVIIAVNERGASPFGLALTLTTATFAAIALINVKRFGKPWVAATTGISLAGIAVVATVWNYFLG